LLVEKISSEESIQKLDQLRTFISQIEGEQCQMLQRWLEWMIEVARTLIGYNSSEFEHVLKLASTLASEGTYIGHS
jgi:hypothetical protein